MTVFVGLDGEGINREDGSQDYTLLAASDNTCVEEWGPRGISTEDCFAYLFDVADRNPGAVFIGFSFGYDTNMILRDCSRSTIERLHQNNSVDWMPRNGIRYYINYIQNKWLGVSKFVWQNNNWKRTHNIKVWDVFGFFQMSFKAALKDWKVGAADQEFIADMKDKRGKFTDNEREEIKRYCWLECKWLSTLGDRLQESLDDADISLSQWHGAGAIANALLNRHRATDFILQKPDHPVLWDAILRAYFGGRIETFATGFIPVMVYDYDINSAYPNAIRKLPNLAGAKWKQALTYDPRPEYALWRVSWQLPEEPVAGLDQNRIAPFPFRDGKGLIYYLKKGEGWYHAPEVRAAMETGFKLQIHDGIICEPADDSRPFEWVEEIYHDRQAAKQRGDKREKVLKLGLNSLYGKFAQAVSGKNKPGKFQCFFYAGWITSYCRSMLLRAAMQQPENIVAFATDGILTLKQLDVEQGKSLGQWEAKESIDDGLLVIQPGLVISRYESFVRTRGVDRSSIGFDVFMNAWRKYGIGAKVVTTDTRFISMGTALARSYNTVSLNEKWRRWVSHDTEIGFFPQRKWPAMTLDAWMPDTFTWLELREGMGGLSGAYKKLAEIDHQEVEPIEFVDSIRIAE